MTDVVSATRAYEHWMAARVEVVRADLDTKHADMAADAFTFFRATFYRWCQLWPEVCRDEAAAPRLLALGDPHVENFGTWRDTEGRLVWGANDFDEAHALPYTNDLVRLATSARLAAAEGALVVSTRDACAAILAGYRGCLKAKGTPFVIEAQDRWLRRLVLSSQRDPAVFWARIARLPDVDRPPPAGMRALRRALRAACVAGWRGGGRGEGSLGRQRLLAVGNHRGGMVAREAKSLLPSAWEWAHLEEATGAVYQLAVDQAVRDPDPTLHLDGGFIVRRLAPDCCRLRLRDLPRKRDDARLLHAMGWEVGNVHLGSKAVIAAVRADLAARPESWLRRSARDMADTVRADWKDWRRAHGVAAEESGLGGLIVRGAVPAV